MEAVEAVEAVEASTTLHSVRLEQTRAGGVERAVRRQLVYLAHVAPIHRRWADMYIQRSPSARFVVAKKPPCLSV